LRGVDAVEVGVGAVANRGVGVDVEQSNEPERVAVGPGFGEQPIGSQFGRGGG
jgi:hypothetical protein